MRRIAAAALLSAPISSQQQQLSGGPNTRAPLLPWLPSSSSPLWPCSLTAFMPPAVLRSLCPRHSRRSLLSTTTATLRTPSRAIIVPRQLKAYGGTFSESIGERSDHLAGHRVLQSLSPARAKRTHSPLLAKPVKTKMIDSFTDMLLMPELRAALAAMQVATPSPIQQSAIEAILQRKDTLVAAPHGEGKTLAYLVPLYQSMMKDRDVFKLPLRERRPRMILLAPTKELVEQLHGVCKVLDAHTGLRSISFTSCKRAKYHLSRLLKDSMADVIIMGPKAILRLIRARRLFIDDLRYVAVDEADDMLSSLHDHDAVHLLMKIQKRKLYKHLWPVQTQFVFTTPYITRKLEYLVGRRFPDTVPVMFRQRMHRPPQGGVLRHRFMSIARDSEKMAVLSYILKKHGHVPQEVATDEAEAAVHTRPRKLQGTLEAYRASSASGRSHGMDSADHRETNRDAEEGPLLDARTAREIGAEDGASTLDENSTGNEQQQQSVRVVGTNTFGTPAALIKPEASPLASPPPAPASRHSPSAEAAADEAATAQSYRLDPQTRIELEAIRPLHWEHLSAVAAPFTCPIPRTVFAPGARTIIFFHSIDAATALYHQLHAAGFAVSLLHASLPWAVRKDHFRDFASGRTNLLCATDVAARGLDLHVDVVINFDMPTNALAYLSRAGRTARMGRLGRVYSLYSKQQGVIVSAVRAFLRKDIPLEGVSNQKKHMMEPRYAEWRTHRIHALARSYVSMITTKTIPAHLERTYIHHNATWRPIYHPRTVGIHGGVAPRQQQKLMDRVMQQAVEYRKGQLARRKGGRAKFGSRTMKSGVWNDVGGVSTRLPAGVSQSPNPAGPDFGPPSGPPE